MCATRCRIPAICRLIGFCVALLCGTATAASIHTYNVVQQHRVRAVCPNEFAPDYSWLKKLQFGTRADCRGNCKPADIKKLLKEPFYMSTAQQHAVMHAQKLPPPYDITLVTGVTISRNSSKGNLAVPEWSTNGHEELLKGGPSMDWLLTWVAEQHKLIGEVELLPGTYNATYMRTFYQYPAQQMRNRAMLAALTEVVLIADVDYIPGPRRILERMMHLGPKEAAYKQLMAVRDGRFVGALTLLETGKGHRGAEWDDIQEAVLEGNKSHIVSMLATGKVQLQQDGLTSNAGVRQWAKAPKLYPIDYNCSKANDQLFSPALLGLKRALPLFDERIRGYHGDKTAQVNHLTSSGRSQLVGMPFMFLVHAPHDPEAVPLWSKDLAYERSKIALASAACLSPGQVPLQPFAMLPSDDWHCQKAQQISLAS